MPEVRAYECEECGVLGRAWLLPEEADEGGYPRWVDWDDGYVPPEGWLMVLVQRVSQRPADFKRPVEVFCSEKCLGLHFRPIVRRKAGDDDAEEEHPKT